MRVLSCLLLLSSVIWSADDLKLTPEERRAETEWLTSLGLKVPQGGPLVEQPFSGPLTRRSLIVPTEWWRQPGPQEVRADLLRQDLPLLRTLMEKGYGGWDNAARRGWDWAQWFADWDRDLAARGETMLGVAAAFAPLEKLERFQLDNHTGILSRGVQFGSGSRSALLATAPAGSCTAVRTATGEGWPLDARDPAQAPKRARITDGSGRSQEGFYFSYPERRGEAVAIQCGSEWIAVHGWADSGREKAIAELAQKPAEQPSYRTVSERIGYLRLPTFSKQNNEALRRMLPSLPAAAGHEKLLIVDLRQNDGGDAAIEEIMRWVEPAAIKRAFPGSRRLPHSCVYDALRWGYTQNTSQSLKPPLTAALLRSLQASLDSLFQPDEHGCPVKVEETKTNWDYRRRQPSGTPPAGKPRLMVLMDNGCGSDCEGMAYLLSAEAGTVFVGENTFGVGQFIQPGYFILPHTRVKFRIALGMNDIYGDSRSFDGYGLDVDVLLAGGEAQKPGSILKLAEELAR
jgi:hypothetical protein